MRPSIPILVILSLLWLIGGTWLLTSWLCGTSTASASLPYFSVTDGDFNTKAANTFTFGFNGAKANMTQEANNSIKAVAKHLKDNGTRLLTLTGLTTSTESNKDIQDLGLARAEEIKAHLVKAGAPADNIVTKSMTADNAHFSNKNGLLFGGVNFNFSGIDEGMGGTIDNDASLRTITSATDVFSFSYGDGYYEPVMTDGLSDYLGLLRQYVTDNPDTKIYITGYTDDEGSREKSKQWARTVRNLLMDNGFERKEMTYTGKGKEDPIVSNDDTGKTKNNRVEIKIKS